MNDVNDVNDAKMVISTKELAAKLGMSTNTIRKLLKNGELRGVRLGARWLLAPDTVEKLFGRK